VENDLTPTRRHVMTAGAAATLGIAAAATLTACGGSGSTSTSAGSSSAAGTAEGNGAGGSGPLTQLSAVPVGGAAAAKGPDGKPVVVAQPEAGKVVAFSAVCTHQGCTVRPNNKMLVCPCHGSQFDAFTGAVVNGPAASPLPSVAVKVDGGNVVAG
jgi:cytochrome b6-f complex iron-sulfur subunit